MMAEGETVNDGGQVARDSVNLLTPSEQALHRNLMISVRDLRREIVRTAYFLVQVNDRKIHRKLGFDTLGEYASRFTGLTSRQAEEFVAIGRRLPHFSDVEAALESGRLNWSQARLITRRAEPRDQEHWINQAQSLTMRQLEAVLPRARPPAGQKSGSAPAPGPQKKPPAGTGSSVPLPEATPADQSATSLPGPEEARPKAGPRHLTLSFTPEHYALWERLLAKAEGDTREEKILTALASSDERQLAVPYLLVIMECSSCGAAAIPSSRGEIPADPALLKSAHCDAAIEDATGRRRRTIPPRLRRQALQRARFRCEAEGCAHAQFLEVHHRLPAAAGGGHDLENLIVLCSRCHRSLHAAEGAARIALRRAP
ncbi:MAG: HNH endonuclease [bacterium]